MIHLKMCIGWSFFLLLSLIGELYELDDDEMDNVELLLRYGESKGEIVSKFGAVIQKGVWLLESGLNVDVGGDKNADSEIQFFGVWFDMKK